MKKKYGLRIFPLCKASQTKTTGDVRIQRVFRYSLPSASLLLSLSMPARMPKISFIQRSGLISKRWGRFSIRSAYEFQHQYSRQNQQTGANKYPAANGSSGCIRCYFAFFFRNTIPVRLDTTSPRKTYKFGSISPVTGIWLIMTDPPFSARSFTSGFLLI